MQDDDVSSRTFIAQCTTELVQRLDITSSTDGLPRFQEFGQNKPLCIPEDFAIAKMGWEVLPHPSDSPDLAPSDCHLFGFVKDQLREKCFETRPAIQKAVRQCLRMAGTKCVQRSGDYVEK
jgi:hypothetical protein